MEPFTLFQKYLVLPMVSCAIIIGGFALGLKLAYQGFYLPLHCSIVGCAEAESNLSFGKLPTPKLSLRVLDRKVERLEKTPLYQSKKMPVGTQKAMLASACGKDEKCVCINHAIFVNDSSWATAGIGKKLDNPCNMRPPHTWKPSVPFTIYKASGNGYFARFNSLSDGVTACVELYQRYSSLPASKLVSIWTNGGGNKNYRSSVSNCF